MGVSMVLFHVKRKGKGMSSERPKFNKFSIIQDSHGIIGMSVWDCTEGWFITKDGFGSLEDAINWLEYNLYFSESPWLRYFHNQAIVNEEGTIVHYDRNGGVWCEVDYEGKYGQKAAWASLMKCKDGKARNTSNMKAIDYINGKAEFLKRKDNAVS